MCQALEGCNDGMGQDMAEADTRQADLARTFEEAECTGLRLAIKGRLAALLLLALWIGFSRGVDPERVLIYGPAFGLYALLGLCHYVVIGGRFDRPWVKYAFISIDIAVISVLMATQPIYESVEVPQAMVFRNVIFPFYFVILGIAAFSFSPGLVLWSGFAGVGGWLSAFVWAVHDMPVRLDWTDIGTAPTTETFLTIFLSPNFIGIGSRLQESVAFLVVAILIAVVMARARRTVRRQLELDAERRMISELFGRYVPKAVADALIDDRGALQPVERPASILFADIAGFTKLTEQRGAQGIVDIMNAYFDAVSRVITAKNGVITQFLGDAVLATFNVPVEDSGHAANAVAAALDIRALARDSRFDGTALTVRVGVCSGPVIAGSVGGGGRQTYTVYGNTVNLASRLEALNKEHGTDILVAASTVEQLDRESFEAVGEIAVRGFSLPVAVFRPKS